MSLPMSDPIALVKLTNPVEVVAYACGKCGVVAGSVMRDGDRVASDLAAACCAPRVCDCGAPLGRTWGKCDSCMSREADDRLQRRFDAAKKIAPSEWTDPVFDPHGRAGREGYCQDLDELREYYVDQWEGETDDRPTWAWTTIASGGPKPDADDVIEGITQEMHEDAAEDFDADSLQKLLDAWFEEQKCVTYHEDDKTAVVLDEVFWR